MYTRAKRALGGVGCTVELSYAPQLAEYRFGPAHPMQPARFTLAVELARAGGSSATPGPRTRCLNRRRHLAAARARPRLPVRGATGERRSDRMARRLRHRTRRHAGVRGHARGSGTLGRRDACGQSPTSSRDRRRARSRPPAGCTTHTETAPQDSASTTTSSWRSTPPSSENPGLRVAYVDLDAHHGDGVQEAFYERDDVLTVSVHESGRYLYPGTGVVTEIGTRTGHGVLGQRAAAARRR